MNVSPMSAAQIGASRRVNQLCRRCRRCRQCWTPRARYFRCRHPASRLCGRRRVRPGPPATFGAPPSSPPWALQQRLYLLYYSIPMSITFVKLLHTQTVRTAKPPSSACGAPSNAPLPPSPASQPWLLRAAAPAARAARAAVPVRRSSSHNLVRRPGPRTASEICCKGASAADSLPAGPAARPPQPCASRCVDAPTLAAALALRLSSPPRPPLRRRQLNPPAREGNGVRQQDCNRAPTRPRAPAPHPPPATAARDIHAVSPTVWPACPGRHCTAASPIRSQ